MYAILKTKEVLFYLESYLDFKKSIMPERTKFVKLNSSCDTQIRQNMLLYMRQFRCLHRYAETLAQPSRLGFVIIPCVT